MEEKINNTSEDVLVLHHPGDELDVVFTLAIDGAGKMEGSYPEMKAGAAEAAVGLGSYLMNTLYPVSLALTSCEVPSAFDTARILVPRAAALFAEVAEKAGLGFKQIKV